ncbi:MAG: lysophospholipid acyltransferase family protein [Nanoarchaeota archaeon]|nr:lysophospholipid acyltransferase family protein [Nanoarchaeota archaeon]
MVYPIGSLFRFIIIHLVKKIEGLENLPKDTPFVIACNHISFMDIFVIASEVTTHLKKKKVYVVSAMFFFFDVISGIIFSELGGSIRLRRKVHGGFLKSAMKKLRRGNIVCMFPEGIPKKNNKIRKGKTGVARLILKGKVPVVPISIQGTIDVWSKLKWIPRLKRKIEIKIGKPMYFKDYYGKDEDYPTLEKITRIIMKKIALLLGQKYNF